MNDDELHAFLDLPEAQEPDAGGGRWIVIPRWEEFQHYRDRTPVWIKVYTRLLHDPSFHELTFHERGVLISLWLEYAASGREIRDGSSTGTRQVRDRYVTVTRRFGQRVTRDTLESLNRAGFIEFSASKPLAPRYPDASPDKDKEVDKETPKPSYRKKIHRRQVCPDCELGGGNHLADCPAVQPSPHVTELLPALATDEDTF